jgi:ABC-type Fe3+ transport system permease subunit
MGEAIVPISVLVAVAIMLVGSYVLGRLSAHVASQPLGFLVLAIGVASPLIIAAGLFALFSPAREMTYNLVPFGVAILLMPISSGMTFWGKVGSRRQHQPSSSADANLDARAPTP